MTRWDFRTDIFLAEGSSLPGFRLIVELSVGESCCFSFLEKGLRKLKFLCQ